jgi:hypothetical protein
MLSIGEMHSARVLKNRENNECWRVAMLRSRTVMARLLKEQNFEVAFRRKERVDPKGQLY